LPLDNKVKQLAPVRILHHQVDPPRRVEHVIELDNIAMPVPLQNVNLPGNASDVSFVHNLVLLQDLNGHLFAR